MVKAEFTKTMRDQFRAARHMTRRLLGDPALSLSLSALTSRLTYFDSYRAGIIPAPHSFHKSLEVTPSDLDKFFSKSYAQVATLVSPQAVSPKSCELKLDHQHDKTSKAKRRNPLTVRLSDAERAIIEAKAHAAGCSINGYVRAAALGSDYKQPHDPEWTKALLAANRELTAQGSNINQIAKHVNSGTASAAEAEGMVGIVGRSILQTHRAVRAALTHGKIPEP